MVDGLWSDDPLQSDFATVVRRQKALGFNAVRMPFSFKDLAITPARSYAFDCPSLPSPKEIGASVTPSGYSDFNVPELPHPPERTPGKCNDYLPSSSVWDRFIWVIKFYIENGFYVMIDNHGLEDETVLIDSKRWAELWAALAKELLQDPDTAGRVIFDILNEPDLLEIRWESSNGKPALKDLYLEVMDKIYEVSSEAIFAVEGAGQLELGTNYGGKKAMLTTNFDLSMQF